MKPLLIGQAQGPNTDPLRPMPPLPRTSAGGRLAEFAGLSPEEYLATFDRANLLQYFPGRWKRDDKFPRTAAEIAAGAMKPLLGGLGLILLGCNVARAFGYQAQHFDFHQWFEADLWGFLVAVIPLTSGRNHWYRDPANLKESQEFWQQFMLRHRPLEQPEVVAIAK